jgi:predicted permease
MLQSFLTVGQQVVYLFVIVAVGFLLGRAKLITQAASVGMSSLMLYVVMPCTLVVAFQRPLEAESFRAFLLAIPVSAAIHLINIAAAHLAIRDRDLKRRQALRFAAVFSNAAFMGYPLMLAVLGSIGVFYGSAYVLLFTVFAWTYGLRLMGGAGEKFSLRRVLLNPGIISAVIAMGLYLARITLPELVLRPVTYLSEMNTPLPMIVVGYQLSQADLGAALRGAGAWIAAALRLLILPGIALALGLLVHLDRPVLIATVVAASAPPAVLLSMFSARFDGDTALASSVVSVHTILSAFTMPLMVGLAQFLAR